MQNGIPFPHKNLLIHHGVLAPRATWRSRAVVYGRPRQTPQPDNATAADHDGSLVIEGRLPPEQGALLVKALEAADAALCADASAEAPPATDASAESPQAEPRTWRARQADALALLAETTLASEPIALTAGDRHLVQVHVDLPALCGSGDDADQHNARCRLGHGPAIASDLARRLACDGGLVTLFEDGATGTTLDVGRKTRAIPPALRRALATRDQGCRFPGCTATRFVDAHHILHWANGGETKLDNFPSR